MESGNEAKELRLLSARVVARKLDMHPKTLLKKVKAKHKDVRGIGEPRVSGGAFKWPSDVVDQAIHDLEPASQTEEGRRLLARLEDTSVRAVEARGQKPTRRVKRRSSPARAAV